MLFIMMRLLLSIILPSGQKSGIFPLVRILEQEAVKIHLQTTGQHFVFPKVHEGGIHIPATSWTVGTALDVLLSEEITIH